MTFFESQKTTKNNNKQNLDQIHFSKLMIYRCCQIKNINTTITTNNSFELHPQLIFYFLFRYIGLLQSNYIYIFGSSCNNKD